MLAAFGTTLVLKKLWYVTIFLWIFLLLGIMARRGILSPVIRGPAIASQSRLGQIWRLLRLSRRQVELPSTTTTIRKSTSRTRPDMLRFDRRRRQLGSGLHSFKLEQSSSIDADSIEMSPLWARNDTKL
jgi:hypothetical protein